MCGRGGWAWKGGWAWLFCKGKRGEGEERVATHTHTHTLVLLNKLIDCSSWWEEEAALTQADADWLRSLHSITKDQSQDI